MEIKTGCDLVSIERFQKSLRRQKEAFLKKVFTPHEISRARDTLSLAGIFAAKEAVMKALSLKPGCWQDIEIVKTDSGRPSLKLRISLRGERRGQAHEILSQDLSISHDGNFAFATVVFLVSTP